MAPAPHPSLPYPIIWNTKCFLLSVIPIKYTLFPFLGFGGGLKLPHLSPYDAVSHQPPEAEPSLGLGLRIPLGKPQFDGI